MENLGSGLAYCRYWVLGSGYWEKGEDGSRKGAKVKNNIKEDYD